MEATVVFATMWCYETFVLSGVFLIQSIVSVEERNWAAQELLERQRENKWWCLIEVFDPGHAAV